MSYDDLGKRWVYLYLVAETRDQDVAADSMSGSTSWSLDGGPFNPDDLPDDLTLTDNGCSICDGTNTCTSTLSGIVDETAGEYTVRVTVTDDDGGETDKDITIFVEPEDATVWFDADNPVAVQVDTPGEDSGPFFLIAYVRETTPDVAPYGAAAGDINKAQVSMSLAPVGPGPPATVACSYVGVTGTDYDAVLEVTCDFQDVEVNTYSVQVTVDGGYYEGYAEDVLVVYDPSLGFTTGGGWFYWPGTDDKTNFGYTMKYGKKGNRPKGSLLLIRHVDEDSIYRVKTNALFGLALGEAEDPDFGWASFSGKATYKEPGVDTVGNHEFVVYVEDWNEPGAGMDQFWIQVFDGFDTLIPEMSMEAPAQEHTETLEGGNIVVPHGVGGRGY